MRYTTCADCGMDFFAKHIFVKGKPGTNASSTRSAGLRDVWRTHHLLPCLAERVAMDVLYLPIIHLRLAILVATARFDASGSLRLERDLHVMPSRLVTLT